MENFKGLTTKFFFCVIIRAGFIVYISIFPQIFNQRFLKGWITFIVQSYVLICTCIFFLKSSFLKTYLYVLILLAYVHTWYLWRSEVSVRSPGTKVTHGCKPPCRRCQASPDPLHEPQVLSVNYTPLSIFSKNKKAFFIEIEKVHRSVSVKTWLLDLSLRILLHFYFLFSFQLQFPKVFFLRCGMDIRVSIPALTCPWVLF